MNTLIDEIGHQLYLYRVKCDMAFSDRDEGVISQEEYAQAIKRQKEINTNAIKSELLKAILDVVGDDDIKDANFDDYGEHTVCETCDVILIDESQPSMSCNCDIRNQLRQELRTKLTELFEGK